MSSIPQIPNNKGASGVPQPLKKGKDASRNNSAGNPPTPSAPFIVSAISQESLAMPERLIADYSSVRKTASREELCTKLANVRPDGSGAALTPQDLKAVSLEAQKLFTDGYNNASGELDLLKAVQLNNFLTLAENALIDEPVLVNLRRLINPDLLPSDRKLVVDYLYIPEYDRASIKKMESEIMQLTSLISRINIQSPTPTDPRTRDILIQAIQRRSQLESTVKTREQRLQMIKDRVYSFEVANLFNADGSTDISQSTVGKSITALRATGVIGDNEDREITERIFKGRIFTDKDVNAIKILRGIDSYGYGLMRNVWVAMRDQNSRAWKKAKNDLLDYINRLESKTSSAPVGSEERIESWWVSNILVNFAILTNGISSEELSMARLRHQMERPEHIDLNDLSKWEGIFSAIAESPEKTDNIRYRPQFLDKLKKTVRQYVASRDPMQKDELLSVLHIYSNYLTAFNVSLAEYKELLKDMIPQRRGPLTMEDLKAKRGLIVQPEDLPEIVKANLRKSGDWENVRKALFVALTRRINVTDGLGNDAAGGLASGGLFITIDAYDEATRSTHNAEWLTHIIAHEGAHVGWFVENHDNELLMRSTVDERNAYLTSMNSSTSMLRRLIRANPNPSKEVLERMKDLSLEICSSRRAVINANRMIGYPQNDLSIRKDVVDKAQNLRVYPVGAFPDVEPSETLSLLKILMPDLGDKFIRDIFMSQSPVYISFWHNGAEDAKRYVTSNVHMFTEAPNSMKVPLLPADVAKLEKLIVEIFKRYGEKIEGDRDPLSRALAMLAMESSKNSGNALFEKMKQKARELIPQANNWGVVQIDLFRLLMPALATLKYETESADLLANMIKEEKGRPAK